MRQVDISFGKEAEIVTRPIKTIVMTVNFIVKISNVARICLVTKVKSSFMTKNVHIPLKTYLPNMVISSEKKLLKKDLALKTSIRHFRVTSPNRALPPILVFVLRYVAKIGAILSGRLIRKWYKNLPPEEKKKVLYKIRSKKTQIAFVGTVFVGALCLYYLEHIVEDPITKRRKFVILNPKQINQIAEFDYEIQLKMFKSDIVPSGHPIYRRVSRVAYNLLLSNKDLKGITDKTWSLTVVDRPEITNAFVLPHGKIFVFTGILNMCTNDDQLAVVLAHEISHCVLSHVAETMSKLFFVEFILLVPSVIFWSLFSDAWALFSEWMTAKLAKIIIHLPFQRSLEKEADFLGLQIAAKSCYDVREALVFWGKMKILSKDAKLEWLSTHPSHERRQYELKEILPLALGIREKNHCPPLLNRIYMY